MKELASIACVAGVFGLYSLYLYGLAASFVDSVKHVGNGNSSLAVRFPRNLTELTQLAKLLNFYKQRYWSYVLLLFCSAYVYKQCFAIPGSVFLNLLAGALFGVRIGFPLCCLLTACGASGCFLLSKHFGKALIERFFIGRLLPLQRRVQENRDSLFMFLLFLRLFPMSPNWFLNIAAPVLNVPLLYFFPSVFFGLMPYNFLTVEAGVMLSSLTSVNEMFTLGTLCKMLGVSLLALGFVLAKRRLKVSAADAIGIDVGADGVGGSVSGGDNSDKLL